MTAKTRYALSDIEPNKQGGGFQIRATPNAYAPTLTVKFETEAEARAWLQKDSKAWLAKLEASRNSKRPRDPAQLAKLIVDIATDEVEEKVDTGFTKRARAGGLKGGHARSASLTPEQRSEIARTAAEARWKKS